MEDQELNGGDMPGSHYTGKAGQFAAMAELSKRGYNVSIPEIDRGDDVFVLNDVTGHLDRIQVKTSTCRALVRQRGAFRGQFTIKTAHVADAGRAGSHYIFVGICGNRWRFVVIERAVLRHLIGDGWGTELANGTRMISIVFMSRTDARSSTRADGLDLSRYAGNWDAWPVLE